MLWNNVKGESNYTVKTEASFSVNNQQRKTTTPLKSPVTWLLTKQTVHWAHCRKRGRGRERGWRCPTCIGWEDGGEASLHRQWKKTLNLFWLKQPIYTQLTINYNDHTLLHYFKIKRLFEVTYLSSNWSLILIVFCLLGKNASGCVSVFVPTLVQCFCCENLSFLPL